MSGMPLKTTGLDWAPFTQISGCDRQGRHCSSFVGSIAVILAEMGAMYNFTLDVWKPRHYK